MSIEEASTGLASAAPRSTTPYSVSMPHTLGTAITASLPAPHDGSGPTKSFVTHDSARKHPCMPSEELTMSDAVTVRRKAERGDYRRASANAIHRRGARRTRGHHGRRAAVRHPDGLRPRR